MLCNIFLYLFIHFIYYLHQIMYDVLFSLLITTYWLLNMNNWEVKQGERDNGRSKFKFKYHSSTEQQEIVSIVSQKMSQHILDMPKERRCIKFIKNCGGEYTNSSTNSSTKSWTIYYWGSTRGMDRSTFRLRYGKLMSVFLLIFWFKWSRSYLF